MTKTIIIGAENEEKGKLKPIEIKHYLHGGKERILSCSSELPTDWEFLELICKDYMKEDGGCCDLIFGYTHPDERNFGCLFLGKWNDGVIE